LESAFTTFASVLEDALMDNPCALVVRRDAVSRSVQFNDKLVAFVKHWASVLSPAPLSGAHEGQDRERCRLREE
jgi:hypothetical protein